MIRKRLQTLIDQFKVAREALEEANTMLQAEIDGNATNAGLALKNQQLTAKLEKVKVLLEPLRSKNQIGGNVDKALKEIENGDGDGQ